MHERDEPLPSFTTSAHAKVSIAVFIEQVGLRTKDAPGK
jgi:hypothetical protein